MKQKFINYFKSVVIETSKLSTCASICVGAVLVKDNRILAISYNGVAPGMKHCNKIFNSAHLKASIKYREKHHYWSINNELHSEQNLISFCAKNNIHTNNASLFISISPCITCAKLIVAAGIKSVYYINIYDYDGSGVKFLNLNNVICKKI